MVGRQLDLIAVNVFASLPHWPTAVRLITAVLCDWGGTLYSERMKTFGAGDGSSGSNGYLESGGGDDD